MKIKEFLSSPYPYVALIVITFFILTVVLLNKTSEYNSYEERLTLQYERAKCNLVESVQAYIDSIAPMSGLEGIVLVDKCIEYNIDVCFVLAQGQKESHFGTQGLARKTNSVWNVFAYDGLSHEDIVNKGKYRSANASIEPYLELLQRRYLKNKSEYDLLNKFVDTDGKRYASASNYESDLRSIYERIKNNTSIDTHVQEMKKYNMLLGK